MVAAQIVVETDSSGCGWILGYLDFREYRGEGMRG